MLNPRASASTRILIAQRRGSDTAAPIGCNGLLGKRDRTGPANVWPAIACFEIASQLVDPCRDHLNCPLRTVLAPEAHW